ncbi:NAD(P)-dependent oxidoreductase [Anaerobacillus sp. MEB173]|uniref:NAD(P)-dependent oxidoreductase n=1 Tax=Anaerobacillus sp. MEB173 TaxID=3383345 RepID=UPI003F8F09C5
MRIGFIGLGTMGLPMTKNTIDAGFETFVVSRSRPPIEEAIAYGAKEASSPKELIELVDIVLTCLPLPDTILDVYEGEFGLIAGATKGKIVIDHSTVSPQLNDRVSKALQEKGAEFMDAPVSGGPMGAVAGTLTIMCGGDHQTFEKAYPVLKAMGEHVIHVGPLGCGSTVKLINNLLVGIHNTALAEAFVIGEKAGVNPEVLYSILKNSVGHSKSIDWAIDAILDRQFEQRFSINLLHKDMTLALDLAKRLEVPIEVGPLAEKLIAAAKENYGSNDVAAIIRPLEEKTGVIVKRRKNKEE